MAYGGINLIRIGHDLEARGNSFTGTHVSWVNALDDISDNLGDSFSAEALQEIMSLLTVAKFEQATTWEKLKPLLEEAEIEIEDHPSLSPETPVPYITKAIGKYIAEEVVENRQFTDDRKFSLIPSDNPDDSLVFRLGKKDSDLWQDFVYFQAYSDQHLNPQEYLTFEKKRVHSEEKPYSRLDVIEKIREFRDETPDLALRHFDRKINGKPFAVGKLPLASIFDRDKVSGVPEGTDVTEFAVAEGIDVNPYTADSVLETINAHKAAHGGKSTFEFKDVIQQGPLADGKRTWFNIYKAFHDDKVLGVPKGTEFNDFMVGNDALKANRRKAIYSRENVLEAVRAYQAKHDGDVPGQRSGLIEDAEFADGNRKWNLVVGAFKHDMVLGVPAGTSFSDFLVLEGILPQQVYPKTSKPVLDNVAVFNTLAWHILKEGPDADIDEAREIPYARLAASRRIKTEGSPENVQTLSQNFSERSNRTYGDLEKVIRSGEISSIPQSMPLEDIVTLIKIRLDQKNFNVPTEEELQEFMDLKTGYTD